MKKRAGFFEVGDLVLFGKYKNKKGRIVRMFVDEKGHPAVEIEPIPKGRKQNKIMGLFKFWHAPDPVEEKKAMSDLIKRVAARALAASESSEMSPADRKKAVLKIYKDFPPDSKRISGGKHIVMLSGDVAKRFGQAAFSNITIEDLSEADLKKLAQAVGVRIASEEELVARVLNASSRQERVALDHGKTFENELYRIHRYSGSIRVTHLLNAGKRGKKVEVLSLYTGPAGDDMIPWESIGAACVMQARRNVTLDKMRAEMEQYLDIFKPQLQLEVRQERGVDVTPGGFATLSVRGKNVSVEVGFKDFTIKNLNDPNETTCIPAISGGLSSIPVIYRWVKDNEDKIKSMDFHTVIDALGDLGVRYHQYCAMD